MKNYLTILRTQFYIFYKIYNIEGTQVVHGKRGKGDKGKCPLLLFEASLWCDSKEEVFRKENPKKHRAAKIRLYARILPR